MTMAPVDDSSAFAFHHEDIRQTSCHAAFLQKKGWIVERVPDSKGARFWYVYIRRILFFPFCVLKIQRYTTVPSIDAVRALIKKYHVFYVVVEPANAVYMQERARHDDFVRALGLKLSKTGFLCTKTRVLSLYSLAAVKKGLSENARRMISRSADSADVVQTKVLGGDSYSTHKAEFDAFFENGIKFGKLWTLSMKEMRALVDVYKDRLQIVFSYDTRTGKQLSGILMLLSSDTAFYFRAWADAEGKSRRVHAKTVWTALVWCIEHKLKWFDFDGIFDARFPIQSWKGFSEFKRKFGGFELEFPGSFERVGWFLILLFLSRNYDTITLFLNK